MRTFGLKRARSVSTSGGGGSAGAVGAEDAAEPVLVAYRPLSSASSSSGRRPSSSLQAPLLSRSNSLQQPARSVLSQSSSGSSPSPPPPSHRILVAPAAGVRPGLQRPPSGASASFIAAAASAATAASSSAAKPAAPLPARRLSSSNGNRADLDIVDDPFADGDDDDDPFGNAGTQPLDEPDSPLPASSATAPPRRTLSRTASSSSAAASATPGHASSNVVLSVLSSPTLTAGERPQLLHGRHRQLLDDIQFLLDGLAPTASASVRASTAAQLLSTILDVQPPSEAHAMAPQQRSSRAGENCRDALMCLRSSNSYSALADLMPDAAVIRLPDNEVFATLFASVALVASQDAEHGNAAFFSARGAELLFTMAFHQADASSKATASSAAAYGSQGDDAPAATAASATPLSAGPGVLRQKRRQAKPTVTPLNLRSVLRQHQALLLQQNNDDAAAEQDAVDRRSLELHLQALEADSWAYSSLQALTAFSADASFARRLLQFADDAGERVLRAVLQELHSVRQQLIAAQAAVPRPAATSARGKKKAPAAAADTASVPPSSDLFLLQHRLQRLLALLENLLGVGGDVFSRFASLRVGDADSKDAQSTSALQLLLEILLDCEPNIERRQQTAVADQAAASADEKDAAHTATEHLLLPSAEPHSVVPLLTILRVLCNATNHDAAAAESMNVRYALQGQQLSGLAAILRVVCSVRWSVLSQSRGGQHDLFNVLAVALPILINCVEENDNSRRIIELECVCFLLPENSDLTCAAHASLPSVLSPPSPPVAAGDVSAVAFLCALWSHLHHQLQLRAAERDAHDAAHASDDDAVGERKQSADVEMSFAERVADPFAAAAARAKTGGAAALSAAPVSSELEAHLAEAAQSADEAAEEQSLGYRTLASLCSLLLGFFATSSSSSAESQQRLLASLRLPSFQPLVRLVKEFLLLQSDAQMLQQEGLQASFDMCDRLEKLNKALALVAASPAASNDTDERQAKRARVAEASPEPARSPTRALSDSLAAASFDTLFGRQQRK